MESCSSSDSWHIVSAINFYEINLSYLVNNNYMINIISFLLAQYVFNQWSIIILIITDSSFLMTNFREQKPMYSKYQYNAWEEKAFLMDLMILLLLIEPYFNIFTRVLWIYSNLLHIWPMFCIFKILTSQFH